MQRNLLVTFQNITARASDPFSLQAMPKILRAGLPGQTHCQFGCGYEHASIGAVDAEIHDLNEREFPCRRRKKLESIARHGAIMTGTFDRVFERAVLVHDRDRKFKIPVRDLSRLKRAPPEVALLLGAAPERQDDGESDLAFAEVVSDILAKLCRGAAIVEGIVDQLKGNSEIHAIAAAGGNLGLRPLAKERADLGGSAEQSGRLGADHGEIIILTRLHILRGRKLHNLAFRNNGSSGGERMQARERSDLDHHFERLAEQEIADEHACFIAPE